MDQKVYNILNSKQSGDKLNADQVLSNFNNALLENLRTKMFVRGIPLSDDAVAYMTEIKTHTQFYDGQDEQPPFYAPYKDKAFPLTHQYKIDKNTSERVIDKEVNVGKPLVVLEICYNFNSFGTAHDAIIDKIGVPVDTFDKFAKEFDIKKYKFTEKEFEKKSRNQHDYTVDFLKTYVGKMVYDPKTVTVDMIKDASDLQLNALNNMFKDIITINFDGNVPERFLDDVYDTPEM